MSVRRPLPTRVRVIAALLSFAIPIGAWCLISYHPGLWHPYVEVEVPGGNYAPGDLVPREEFPDVVAEIQRANPELSADGMRGSSLRRHNGGIVGKMTDIAIANGWIAAEQRRDLDAVVAALREWEAGERAAESIDLNAENREILRYNLDLLTADAAGSGAELPRDAILRDLVPEGRPANPVYLPAPHRVAQAFYGAFTTEPRREEDPWLHQRLGHTLEIIFTAFGLAMLIGIPLGILAGTFDLTSRLFEPFFSFVSYIPPPAFGALLIAVFGIEDGPKVAMVFIAAFFPMVLMIANTTRLLPTSLLEAGQVLGCSNRQLLGRVILPGILPNLFNDLRILLALGWTILIIAEVTGTMSGLSYYMYQQGRYRVYENVFAVMILIGCIGLVIDQFLAWLAPFLFPWHHRPPGTASRWVMRMLTLLPRQAGRFTRYVHEGRVEPGPTDPPLGTRRA